MTEFHLSVVERTISMMSHFVVNLAEGKKVDDMRRAVAEPYAETIQDSLAALSERGSTLTA